LYEFRRGGIFAGQLYSCRMQYPGAHHILRELSVAQKTQVILIDDIDGGPATETVAFSLDGSAYEIDLTAANAGRLRDAFAPYVGAARRTGSRSGNARRSRRSAGDGRTATIRAWAKDKNLKVNERGRIPADIVAQYDAAH
jgi:Lsr2